MCLIRSATIAPAAGPSSSEASTSCSATTASGPATRATGVRFTGQASSGRRRSRTGRRIASLSGERKPRVPRGHAQLDAGGLRLSLLEAADQVGHVGRLLLQVALVFL